MKGQEFFLFINKLNILGMDGRIKGSKVFVIRVGMNEFKFVKSDRQALDSLYTSGGAIWTTI
jgi:hypothetical protein